jgi:hypothetical protein
MNSSARWSEDMAVDETVPLSVALNRMIIVQRYIFVLLATLSAYFFAKIATNSLMHLNFRLVLVSFSWAMNLNLMFLGS